jgi:hypothetical protein
MQTIDRENFTAPLEFANGLDITILDDYEWGLFGETCIAVTGPVEHLLEFMFLLGCHEEAQYLVDMSSELRTVVKGGGYVVFWPGWRFADRASDNAE